jgi:hypothetical protein
MDIGGREGLYCVEHGLFKVRHDRKWQAILKLYQGLDHFPQVLTGLAFLV